MHRRIEAGYCSGRRDVRNSGAADYYGIGITADLCQNNTCAMPMTNRKLFSLFTVVFSLMCSVMDSGAQMPARSGFDPDDPPETNIRLAPYLMFGAQLEFEYKLIRNPDLDGSQDDDHSTIEPALVLAFSFDPIKYVQIYADMKLAGEFVYRDGRTERDRATFEFEQAYILFKEFWEQRLAFQIGRMRFEDERQWLYDAELDGGRAFLRFSDLLAEFSVTRGGIVDRDLLNKDAGSKTNNYVAYFTYTISEETNIAAYFLFRDNTKEEDDSPVFLGVHSDGELSDNFDYWLELAYVIGTERADNIGGVGLDAGITYAFDVMPEPSFTLGYAFGEKNFRQSGLQGNEGDFNGAADFLYYGELLEPELSNLSIFTAGVGLNPIDEGSIDVVYHYYLQAEASDSLRDSELDAEPDGKHKSIGSEIDLILGYEGEESGIAAALSFGYFIPGSAFPDASANSFSTKVILEYKF